MCLCVCVSPLRPHTLLCHTFSSPFLLSLTVLIPFALQDITSLSASFSPCLSFCPSHFIPSLTQPPISSLCCALQPSTEKKKERKENRKLPNPAASYGIHVYQHIMPLADLFGSRDRLLWACIPPPSHHRHLFPITPQKEVRDVFSAAQTSCNVTPSAPSSWLLYCSDEDKPGDVWKDRTNREWRHINAPFTQPYFKDISHWRSKTYHTMGFCTKLKKATFIWWTKRYLRVWRPG